MELSEHQLKSGVDRQVPALLGVETFADYKTYLRHRIQTAARVKGYKTLLAQSAGCHPSFISQVLNTSVHLTPDHGAGLAEFWGLEENDTEYFLCLVQKARAASPALAKVLSAKLNRLKAEKQDLANRFRSPRLAEPEKEALYYSSWLYSAVHVLVSIPQYQRPAALAEKLGISLKSVNAALESLREMGLVAELRDRWRVTGKSLHLPRQSPYFGNHLLNWRHRALVTASVRGEQGVHYSAVHALSHEDGERLRRMVHAFLDETRAVVAPSEEQQAVCLNLDFFPL